MGSLAFHTHVVWPRRVRLLMRTPLATASRPAGTVIRKV
jgi:hypothetical protein